ncbi:flagellar basal-body rod protein FlgG [Paenibacillus phyllosphaerae]|uniref:Flagellar basal-body rod protein FlgG n=1 Tax=Paenibacillus phyllosphaerae TaxID=274593 RepID=A0A7W5AXH9_9BACL|nr:flagellar hook-basal body protein [Paenibacillus phyllosphaerae]MBB3110527.1 flagellar basal-body rod protein FlgG [Paenibacillus phyllosphaerae]
MNSSMINAMVSMNGLQQKLDLLADNIANVNTVGYKRKEASFEDLLTTMTQQPEDFSQPGRRSPLGFNQGWGSRLVSIQPDLSQGPLQQTDLPYDLAISGNALFEVITDDAGTTAYTRNGAFQATMDASGETILTTKEGYPVVGTDGDRIILPTNAKSVRIDEDGSIVSQSQAGEFETIGQVRLMQAQKPAMLTQVADNLYTIADGMNVGDVLTEVDAGTDSDITIRQGYLEQSNVDLTEEMTELTTVQRAYQLTARALTSSDTMMGLANNLRA